MNMIPLLFLFCVAAGIARAQERTRPELSQWEDGSLALRAADATVHGREARLGRELGHEFIGWWTSAKDFVSWNLLIGRGGEFHVEIEYSCPPDSAGSDYEIRLNGQRVLAAQVASTGSWQIYKSQQLGKLTLGAGRHTLVLQPTSKPGAAVMDLKEIRLCPAK